MVWIVVASSMKLQGDVGVNPHREVIVQYVEWLTGKEIIFQVEMN